MIYLRSLDLAKVEDAEEAAARERLSRMQVRPTAATRPAGSTAGRTSSTGSARSGPGSGAGQASAGLETSSFFEDVDNEKWEDLDAPSTGACQWRLF